jgi:hypothetical protein
VNNIFAANENIFRARDKMNWNVDPIKPFQIVRWYRGFVHSHVESGTTVIKATKLKENDKKRRQFGSKQKMDSQTRKVLGKLCANERETPVLICNCAKIV